MGNESSEFAEGTVTDETEDIVMEGMFREIDELGDCPHTPTPQH